MKGLVTALIGAVIGGALAVLLGSAEAIREANDRAHQAREVAAAAVAQAAIQGDTISRQTGEIQRLKNA